MTEFSSVEITPSSNTDHNDFVKGKFLKNNYFENN